MPILEYRIFRGNIEKPFCVMFCLSRAISVAHDLAKTIRGGLIFRCLRIGLLVSFDDRDPKVRITEFKNNEPTGDEWKF